MSYELITYELKDAVAVIAFNDPKTMNACGVDTAQELLHAVQTAGSEARCTVITGTGRGFCSGANLGKVSGPQLSHPGSKPDAGRALETHYNPLIEALREHPHPVITAVNGAAAGVGCSIALMGDLIVAAKSAYFLQAFRRIGLVPDGGSTWLLARNIGRVRAMEMALFGEKLPAEKALEWGMVNRVVDDGALMPTVLEMAETLATGPTIALAAARKLIWDACESGFSEALMAERFAQRTAGRTKDFAEGVSAFLQKRPAKFTGN
ncbi:MAG TPA: enoyl-CoA hydratase/isomerase [Hyphomonas sp.]|nr:enoyl-CoA hydratase/isomerase [Hyphomonas sp.]MCA8904785.1 enoyl-CoA hydratase/isomerase [Hyphomonas sp.]MCB9962536.1 enoyl-CoA hydratase/isomerase [Hyphomonas sp.]MCB9972012.1 enoyl-CoA hydratase/isomerase [Hyphomonas sp.]HPE47427.1 enoyl-CoA hydratase/isomerase [Hyphomonas sp.]